MTERSLWLPVKPRVKQRPRLGRGRRVFTPEATLEYEATIRDLWAVEHDPYTPDTPLAVEILYTPDGSLVTLRPAEFSPPTGLKKGDLDNYVKATLDGLQGAAFSDDKMIVDLQASKRPAGFV